jgi:hypothetical protein
MKPLHQSFVARLIDQLTDKEAAELDAYASEGGTPEAYVERANEWLLRRFPDLIIVAFAEDELQAVQWLWGRG